MFVVINADVIIIIVLELRALELRSLDVRLAWKQAESLERSAVIDVLNDVLTHALLTVMIAIYVMEFCLRNKIA